MGRSLSITLCGYVGVAFGLAFAGRSTDFTRAFTRAGAFARTRASELVAGAAGFGFWTCHFAGTGAFTRTFCLNLGLTGTFAICATATVAVSFTVVSGAFTGAFTGASTFAGARNGNRTTTGAGAGAVGLSRCDFDLARRNFAGTFAGTRAFAGAFKRKLGAGTLDFGAAAGVYGSLALGLSRNGNVYIS